MEIQPNGPSFSLDYTRFFGDVKEEIQREKMSSGRQDKSEAPFAVDLKFNFRRVPPSYSHKGILVLSYKLRIRKDRTL